MGSLIDIAKNAGRDLRESPSREDSWLIETIDNHLEGIMDSPRKGVFFPSAMSNTCDRVIWLSFNGLMPPSPMPPNLRRIFGQPQKQPDTVQSTVAPAFSSSQSQQPFETYLQQRTGRDGEIYFTPETTNPNASNMQIIYKPEQVFGPTQFINLLKNASKNSTLGRDTDSKTFKPDINLEEVNDNQEAPNFLEMTDEQLVAASLSARGLKNSKGFGILTLAKRGAGSLANREI